MGTFKTIAGLFNNKAAAVGAMIGLLAWASLAFSMARIESPRTGQQVTRAELVAETVTTEAELNERQTRIDKNQADLNNDFEKWASLYGQGFTAIDAKEQRKADWLRFGASAITAWSTGNPLSTADLIGSAFGLLGMGAAGGATARGVALGSGKLRDRIKTKTPPA